MADVDAPLLVNFNDLDLQLVADMHNVLHALYAMLCELGDVAKPLFPGEKFYKSAELQEACHAAGINLSDLNVADDVLDHLARTIHRFGIRRGDKDIAVLMNIDIHAGLVDDLDAGAHDGDAPAKGLAGHLGALSRGRLTTGVLKMAMIGSGALVSGALMARRRSAMSGESESLATAADAAISAMAIATWTNVHNLLDLRPGRALKTAALLSGALLADGREGAEASRALAAGGLGVVAAALPEDLMENTMLGDTGANAVGAVVGTALAAHPSRTVRGLAALVGTALVLASERVSFTRVIDRTPVLAALDGLGRRVS